MRYNENHSGTNFDGNHSEVIDVYRDSWVSISIIYLRIAKKHQRKKLISDNEVPREKKGFFASC